MKNINHPIGNIKIFIIKKTAEFIKATILNILSLLINIKKNQSEVIISRALFAPWKEDKHFKQIQKKICHLTLLDNYRLYTLWYLSKSLSLENGNIFDIGCMKGGAGLLMAKANIKGNTYLFDTFCGFMEEEIYHKKKHFIYTDLNELKKNASMFGLKKAKVIKCIFPNNLPRSLKNKKIKLCHIDVNTYKSTKKAFYFVDKRMEKNGIIIFDDYGIFGTDSIKKFIKEIKKNYSKKYIFLYNFMGQCILIKKN